MPNTLSSLMNNVLTDGAKNAVGVSHGRVRAKIGNFVSVVGDLADHIYPMARFRAQDRLIAIYLNNTADAGWTDLNIGVYAGATDGLTTVGDWNDADQSVVDADILVDNQDRSLASAGHDELLGAGANAFAETLEGATLWEMAGVASDPGNNVEYDVACESVGDPSGGGQMNFIILYTAGD